MHRHGYVERVPMCHCTGFVGTDTYLTVQKGRPVSSVSSKAGRAVYLTHPPNATMPPAAHEQD